MFVWPIFANIFQHYCKHILRLSQHCLVDVRDTYQKLAGGKGEWKTGEGHSFFEPFKREGYEKNDSKRGRVTRN